MYTKKLIKIHLSNCKYLKLKLSTIHIRSCLVFTYCQSAPDPSFYPLLCNDVWLWVKKPFPRLFCQPSSSYILLIGHSTSKSQGREMGEASVCSLYTYLSPSFLERCSWGMCPFQVRLPDLVNKYRTPNSILNLR